jgi:hypothetical protein
MQISRFVLALLAASVLATGCAKQKAPATKAVEAIESSLAEVKADAERYAPEGLKGVESQLARLKTSLEAEEYDNVLAGTPQLEKAVASLKDAVVLGQGTRERRAGYCEERVGNTQYRSTGDDQQHSDAS